MNAKRCSVFLLLVVFLLGQAAMALSSFEEHPTYVRIQETCPHRGSHGGTLLSHHDGKNAAHQRVQRTRPNFSTFKACLSSSTCPKQLSFSEKSHIEFVYSTEELLGEHRWLMLRRLLI